VTRAPAVGDELDLGPVVATLRALIERTGALRAVLLLDRGDAAAPLVVDCGADGSAEVVGPDGASEEPATAAAGAEPVALPGLSVVPPLEVDLAESTVTGPLGALDAAARAVRAGAAAFGGRSVVTVGFATSDPDAPLFLAAREGDPLVASLADAEYELPPDWPG
jgi:hypothetical protein